MQRLLHGVGQVVVVVSIAEMM